MNSNQAACKIFITMKRALFSRYHNGKCEKHAKSMVPGIVANHFAIKKKRFPEQPNILWRSADILNGIICHKHPERPMIFCHFCSVTLSYFPNTSPLPNILIYIGNIFAVAITQIKSCFIHFICLNIVTNIITVKCY